MDEFQANNSVVEINLDHLDKRTKAFCSFIGYIFQHMMALEHLSSEQYIQLVRELNKTLPTDVGDWSNLEYVTRFVNKDMEYLNSRVSEVMGGLNRLGIVAEPKFET